jgi:hypothetical protein
VGLKLLALLAPAALLAQTQFLTFSSSVDSSEQPYALYVPEDFNPAQKYALLVSLHTEDSNQRLNVRQVLGAPNRSGRPEHADSRFLIAFPSARGSMGYRGIAEQDVYDMVAAIERRYPIDADRVYLTGASMGGGGALWLAATHPDRWAAVAALCPATIPGTEELAPNLSNVPVRFYHGEQDTIVPASVSRGWHRKLLDIGVPASYIEYPTLRHNAWDLAYRQGAALDWLWQFRRNRSPEHVRLVSTSYRYASAYWVRIDGLTPGTAAEIDARREGSRVVVQTKNVDGFTVWIDQSTTGLTVDGESRWRIRSSPNFPIHPFSLVKIATGWESGTSHPAGKRAGAEGPIAEILAGRPLYVYGSLGTRTAVELEQRKKLAEKAATWSTARFRVDVTPAVKADSEVTDAELAASDVVLMGTAATNSVLARVAAQLPLALDAGAADYGLLFIAPLGKHYAVVSSGLPWWTGADEADRHPYPFEAEPLALLETFGDYILFKGSLAHVVAEGRFDRNWKLPADAAARMTTTGTVTIR